MSSITLASIDTRDLRALLYGEVTAHDDLITLAAVAQEAGADVADLASVTGEPGHDPRTGVVNALAVYDPDTDVVEDELGAEEPDETALWDPAPRAGEDLEATVTRIGAARDIAEERAANIASDLVEVALESPELARSLASCLRQRGILTGTAAADAGRPVLSGVAA